MSGAVLVSRMYERIRSSSSARSRVSSAWALYHMRRIRGRGFRPLAGGIHAPVPSSDRGIRRASGALGAVHPGDGASHQQGPIVGPPLHSIRPRRQPEKFDIVSTVWYDAIMVLRG